jgi:hypothetical protein
MKSDDWNLISWRGILASNLDRPWGNEWPRRLTDCRWRCARLRRRRHWPASLELSSSFDSGFIAMIFGSKRSGAHRESYLGQKRLEETEARAGDGPSWPSSSILPLVPCVGRKQALGWSPGWPRHAEHRQGQPWWRQCRQAVCWATMGNWAAVRRWEEKKGWATRGREWAREKNWKWSSWRFVPRNWLRFWKFVSFSYLIRTIIQFEFKQILLEL